MRAAITAWSLPGVGSRKRVVILAACGLLTAAGLGFGGFAAQHAWRSNADDQAMHELRAAEAQRMASRYGDVKLPVGREKCRSLAFDNWNGGYVREREVPCEEEKPAQRVISTPDGPGSSAARARGIAGAFRR
jgi:hypothetical protein